jgi:hypothetical protein
MSRGLASRRVLDYPDPGYNIFFEKSIAAGSCLRTALTAFTPRTRATPCAPRKYRREPPRVILRYPGARALNASSPNSDRAIHAAVHRTHASQGGKRVHSRVRPAIKIVRTEGVRTTAASHILDTLSRPMTTVTCNAGAVLLKTN